MDEAARELVRDWLTRASHDLQAAGTLAAGKEPLLDTAIYHCQQAAAVLTPYVSAFRYPGGGSDEPMPSPEEFDEALQHAKTIYDFVLNLLPTEARP